MRNCVNDIFSACFPPNLPSIQHVVINSEAQNQMALRTGAGSTLIPNVMDFDNPPEPMDEYAEDAREALCIEPNKLIVLQPTRVVQRKGIEHAIEFVHRLERDAVLVISHASGDEGYTYKNRVREFAELLKVETRFVDDIVTEERSTTPDGRKTYTLQDIYRHADVVTYPSLIECFGNAFLEAVYFKRMVMVNHYSVYDQDIQPKGFETIDMDEFIDDATMKKAHEWLAAPEKVSFDLDMNYAIAKQHYSYTTLRHQLGALLHHFWGSAL